MKGKFLGPKPYVRMKHPVHMAISIIFSFVLVTVVSGAMYADVMLNKVNYTTDDTSSYTGSVSPDDQDAGTPGDPAVKSAADEGIADANIDNIPITAMSAVTNILLIGSDARAGVDGARSDSMILLSINKNTKAITLASFMRDTYVPIAGYGNNRLNAAYSYGGPTLLTKTIQSDFRVAVTQYIAVDFSGFANIIDQIGGITITLTPAEAGQVGVPAGTQLLNGEQALAYSRIRKIDSDFARTQRQRNVLEAVAAKCKTMSLVQLSSFFDAALPLLTTNIPKSQLLGLLAGVTTYRNYPINQVRIPADGSYQPIVVSGMDVLSINFQKNIQLLQTSLYGDDN